MDYRRRYATRRSRAEQPVTMVEVCVAMLEAEPQGQLPGDKDGVRPEAAEHGN
jgi:hypothetical protein